MSTPTGRREDDPIDEPARQLFWRLRARLVTPPAEQRTQADLDRMFRLARMQAHERPSTGADAWPPADAPLLVTPEHVLGAATADVGAHPAGVGTAEHGVVDGIVDAEVVPIRSRWAAVHGVGRVAAAAVVVFAFGAGVSAARDGITIDALLGRNAVEPQLALDVPDTPDPDAEVDVADLDEASDAVAAPEGGGEPEVSPSPGDDGDDPGPRVAEDPGDPSDGTDTGAGDATPPEPEPAPEPAPTAEIPARTQPAAPRSSDDTSPDSREDPPASDPAPAEGEVIAAPPGSVDGFGGPRPCEEGAEVSECLADNVDTDPSDEDGSAGGPSTGDGAEADPDDGTGDDTSDADATSAAEELARRRFGGDS